MAGLLLGLDSSTVTMNRNPLTESQISEALNSLKGWAYSESQLGKVFRFGNYRETIGFVIRIAFEAEALNHHPTLVVGYNRLHVTTCTHDAGNKVTGVDVALATAIESCMNSQKVG